MLFKEKLKKKEYESFFLGKVNFIEIIIVNIRYY